MLFLLIRLIVTQYMYNREGQTSGLFQVLLVINFTSLPMRCSR